MSNNADIEKDYANRNGNSMLHGDMDSGTALNRIRTAGSISISPELFEKIYLSPQNAVKGDLRKTFGNPTPIALVGFLLSLTPLACDLMGWRGAGGSGAASTGAYYGFGAILMLLGGILEFFLGNTFPSVVFCSFGAFWFTFGSTLVPAFNASGAYAAAAGVPTEESATTPGFASSFAFFLLWMGFLCLIYLVAALRTNIFFVMIFFSLVCAFGCLAGAYWNIARGNAAVAMRCQTAGGAWAFVTCVCGWYLFIVQILASVDFPLSLPVGDLSTVIKGESEKKAQ